MLLPILNYTHPLQVDLLEFRKFCEPPQNFAHDPISALALLSRAAWNTMWQVLLFLQRPPVTTHLSVPECISLSDNFIECPCVHVLLRPVLEHRNCGRNQD